MKFLRREKHYNCLIKIKFILITYLELFRLEVVVFANENFCKNIVISNGMPK